MAVTLEVDFRPITEGLTEAMDEVEARLRDLSPVTLPAAETLEGSIQRGITTGTGILGNSFAPLAQSTIKRKGSSRPLIDTGALRSGIEASGKPTGVVFGVGGAATRYAAAHQFGTARIPARPYLPILGSGAVSFATGPAEQWFERLMNRALSYVLTGEVDQ